MLRLLLTLAALLTLCAAPAHAGWESDAADVLSHEFYNAYLALGLSRGLIEGGEAGETEALRTFDGLATATVATIGLKQVFPRVRPRPLPVGDKDDAFPSGHAAASFSVARLQAEFHPDEAAYWYAGAALISASRVKRGRHRIEEVAAGAALGYLIAELELRSNDGLLIAPFVEPAGDGFGIQLSLDW